MLQERLSVRDGFPASIPDPAYGAALLTDILADTLRSHHVVYPASEAALCTPLAGQERYPLVSTKARPFGAVLIMAGCLVMNSAVLGAAPAAADERARTVLWERINATAVIKGERFTMGGNLLREGDNGRLSDVPNAWVSLELKLESGRWREVSKARTDSEGMVSLSARLLKASDWRLHFRGDDQLAPSVTTPIWMSVMYRTRFSGFNVTPEPVRKGQKVTISGRYLRQVGKSWRGAGSSLCPTVFVYFQPKGSSKWSPVKTSPTIVTDRGYFRTTAIARKDGAWRALCPMTAVTFETGSKSDYVDVR